MRRVVEPAALRYYQWRGDPVARWTLPETKADPYPLYDDIRTRGLVRSPLGPYVTASHGCAEAILRDHRFSSSHEHPRGYQPPSYAEHDAAAGLFSLDPPGHARIRRALSAAFASRVTEDLEPFVRDVTRRLLDTADTAGFDLIDALAFPLSITVICRLLGVPADEQALFRGWGYDVATTVEPEAAQSAGSDPQHLAELALIAYLRDLVAVRRADPDDSLLSDLTAAEEEGIPLSADEVVAAALLVLVTGFETTVNLIGNGAVALLGEPAQWQRLAGDPALLPGAVEEVARYDSPVQLTSRIATEDVEVDGTAIAQGTPVMVVIGGANRDPDVFTDPGRVMVARPNAARHLSFSSGSHQCLGAPLARLQGRVALGELTRRYPGLRLAATPVRRPHPVLRGFASVPVRAPSRVPGARRLRATG